MSSKNLILKVAFALGADNVFGVDGGLPWDELRHDMLAYRAFTNNCLVVMNANTFRSMPHIPTIKHRALNRKYIVVVDNNYNEVTKPLVSKNGTPPDDVIRFDEKGDGVLNYLDLYKKLELISDDHMMDLAIVGGSKMISQFLPYADKVLFTRVDVATPTNATHATYLELGNSLHGKFVLDSAITHFTDQSECVKYTINLLSKRDISCGEWF